MRVEGLDEFFDLAKVFEYLPPLKNNRVAISSFSGGEGVITTDFAQLHGLTLAELNMEAIEKLRSIFPPWEIPVNPFDTGVTGQFHPQDDVLGVMMDAFAGDPNVDCMAVQMGGGPRARGREPREQENEMVNLLIEAKRRGKAVAIWMISQWEGTSQLTEMLESNRIPVYPSAERAIRALGALYRYSVLRRRG